MLYKHEILGIAHAFATKKDGFCLFTRPYHAWKKIIPDFGESIELWYRSSVQSVILRNYEMFLGISTALCRK